MNQAAHIISDFMETPAAEGRAGIRVVKSSTLRSQGVIDTGGLSIIPSLSVSEVAVIIGCGTKKVHDLCNGGKLGFHWVGNKRMFRPEDLENFWNENRSGTSRRKNLGSIDTMSDPSVKSSKHSKGGDKKGPKRGPKIAEVSKAHRLREFSKEMRKW